MNLAFHCPCHLVWNLQQLYIKRNQINFPVYQRQEVWSEGKKALLIDSIFRGIDIPKLYLQKNINQEGEEQWDCIDGHQRIMAIWGFFDGDLENEGDTFIHFLPRNLNEALDALHSDNSFLKRNNIFTDELLAQWVKIKEEEIMSIGTMPHPFEFKMYFNL